MGGFRSSTDPVRFAGFELDPHAGELRKDGVRIRLQEQPLQILRILLEQPGRIVAREDLRQKIWPSDTFVDFDHGINNAIKRLREALGDTTETPRFIETLPRRGYRFIAPIEESPSKVRSADASLDSIAVLPFETASSDPDMDYLSIGIPGSIIHGLSQMPNLRVISWRSAASESSGQSDPLAIGRKLCVRAVLTGRIWQRANKLRLHVDLLDTTNGEEIWGDQYDSDLTELFVVQDSISREVSRNLRLKMTGEAEQRLVKRYTENIEAYQLYVRARRWLEKRSTEGFRRGVEYLRQAIEMDPAYAPAHAELAQCISVPCYYSSVDPNIAYPKARASALRALEIDPDLAEGHAVLANILHTYDWNWKVAEKEYERAIELNPNYATAHYHYSYLLAEQKRFDEAIHEAMEALSREPTSALLNAGLAFVFLLARKYDECIKQALTAIEVDPNMTLCHMVLGVAYSQTGQSAAAIEAYEKGIALGGMLAIQKACIGNVHGRSGDSAKAWKILDELEQLSRNTYVPFMASVFVFEGLGMKDLAIEALEKAYTGRETTLVFLKTWPHFDQLRQDPRFQDVERRIGLRV
ncbi:MAG: tetratricopeptide repeat protein [Acidobacteriia bacterium]|nr:tetratricopeptide repeat protein [Terriglobia bacterium]